MESDKHLQSILIQYGISYTACSHFLDATNFFPQALKSHTTSSNQNSSNVPNNFLILNLMNF